METDAKHRANGGKVGARRCRGAGVAWLVLILLINAGCMTKHMLVVTSERTILPRRIDAAGCSSTEIALWYRADISNHFTHATTAAHRYALLRLPVLPEGHLPVLARPVGRDLPESTRRHPDDSNPFVAIPIEPVLPAQGRPVLAPTNRAVIIGQSAERCALRFPGTNETAVVLECAIPPSEEKTDVGARVLRGVGVSIGALTDLALGAVILAWLYLTSVL